MINSHLVWVFISLILIAWFVWNCNNLYNFHLCTFKEIRMEVRLFHHSVAHSQSDSLKFKKMLQPKQYLELPYLYFFVTLKILSTLNKYFFTYLKHIFKRCTIFYFWFMQSYPVSCIWRACPFINSGFYIGGMDSLFVSVWYKR